MTESPNFGFTALNLTEFAPGKSATANVGNIVSKWPERLLQLDLFNNWFSSKADFKVKTFQMELTAQFNIVMVYIYADNLRQFEVKLGKYFCMFLACHELAFESNYIW